MGVVQGAAMINFYKVFKPGEALNVDDVQQIENVSGIPGFARDAIRAVQDGKVVDGEVMRNMYEAMTERMKVIDKQLQSNRERQQGTNNPAFFEGGDIFTKKAERNIYQPQQQTAAQYQPGQFVNYQGQRVEVLGVNPDGTLKIRIPDADNDDDNKYNSNRRRRRNRGQR